MSRPNEWDAAHRMAREIPACTGAAKHRAISALLAKVRPVELIATHDLRGAFDAAGLPYPDREPKAGELLRFSTNGRSGDAAGWLRVFPDADGAAFDGEIIAEIPKNSRECYRVEQRTFKGIWFDDATTGELRPGKGVSIKLEVLPEIVAALSSLIEGGRR